MKQYWVYEAVAERLDCRSSDPYSLFLGPSTIIEFSVVKGWEYYSHADQIFS